MKLKNVSFFEQHFEKLFAATGVIVLLVVAWMYLARQPNAVQIDGRTLQPGEVAGHIAGKAQQLRSQAESNEVPAMPEIKDIAREFREQATVPVLAVSRFKVPGNRLVDLGETVKPIHHREFIEPQYPAPTMFAWAARIGSLSPDEVDYYPELADLFESTAVRAKAFDTTYVSLVAKWDTAAVLEALTRKDEDEQLRSIHEGRVKSFAIMDVQVQRQTRRPDGTWPEPGDPDFDQLTQQLGFNPPVYLQDGGSALPFSPEDVPSVMDPATYEHGELAAEHAAQLTTLIGSGSNQWLIVQPPFPRMLNEEWEEPLSPEALQARRERLSRQEEIEEIFKEKQARIDLLQTRQEALRNRQRPVAAQPAAPGAGRRAPANRPSAPAGGGAANRQAEAIQAQIDRIVNDEEIARLQEEYRELTNGRTLSLSGSGGPGRAGSYAMFSPEMFGPGPAGAPRQGVATQPRVAPQPGAIPGPGAFDPGFFGGPARMRGAQMAYTVGIQSGVLSHEELTIYSHDLTADPGTTYRYRLRLRVVNPLYNVPDMPDGPQKDKHQHQFLVDTEWTDWTRPIETPRLHHYWVQGISTSPPPGRAKLEVWRYYKGQWRVREISDIRPGTPIGHTEKLTIQDPARTSPRTEDVDFYTGSLLLNIVEAKPLRSGAGSRRGESKALFLEGAEHITERTVAGDRSSELREKLKQDKEVLDRLAGAGSGPVAQRP
jgi:hypothetical protein